MARWRILGPHYLNVPGTEWEYKETDRETGRQGRKIFIVPRLLDPGAVDRQGRNYEEIVCHEGKGLSSDIVFIGEPTPDMEPIDDEAKIISDGLKHKWIHPIESMPASGGDYGAALINKFESMMTEIIQRKGGAVSTTRDPTVAELMAQVKELSAQVAALAQPKPERRV